MTHIVLASASYCSRGRHGARGHTVGDPCFTGWCQTGIMFSDKTRKKILNAGLPIGKRLITVRPVIPKLFEQVDFFACEN